MKYAVNICCLSTIIDLSNKKKCHGMSYYSLNNNKLILLPSIHIYCLHLLFFYPTK